MDTKVPTQSSQLKTSMNPQKGYKVLVVDDEPDIVELLRYNLNKEGYQVEAAQDGGSAVELAQTFEPNLILLDIMMPEQDGVETCRQIRQIPALQNTFILFLTARSEEYSEVAAFDVGADDFITKPIRPRALMSRIATALRRGAQTQVEERIAAGDLIIDKTSYTVSRQGKDVILPKKEFELLYYMASSPGVVLSREMLLRNIWGEDVYVLARTVDVHVRKVREKIGNQYIKTIKGVGYKFEAPAG